MTYVFEYILRSCLSSADRATVLNSIRMFIRPYASIRDKQIEITLLYLYGQHVNMHVTPFAHALRILGSVQHGQIIVTGICLC